MKKAGQTRLILIEGLPSTGKSTNSGVLLSQLERNGYKTRWIHEVARLDPVLFFHEAVLTVVELAEFVNRHPHTAQIIERVQIKRQRLISIDLLKLEWSFKRQMGDAAFEDMKRYDAWDFTLDRYMQAALEKWEHFLDCQSSRQDEIVILDSAVIQYQIYCFLLANAPFELLSEFIGRLWLLMGRLNPTLVYFYRENTENTIEYLLHSRGRQFLQRIWSRDKHHPYYQDKSEGVDGYKQFLRDYAKYAHRLVDMFPYEKIPIEITAGQWDMYTDRVLTALQLDYMNPPEAVFPTGSYVNPEHQWKLEIRSDMIVTPTGAWKRLSVRTDSEFYIHDLPVIIKVEDNGLIIDGEQLIERWTTFGTVFHKVDV